MALKLSKTSKHNLTGFGIGVAVIALVLLFRVIDLFEKIELNTLDYRFVARGQRIPSPEIVIVTIDQAESISNLGSWPWPRSYHARAIDRIKKAGAKVIGLDIDFSNPSPDPAQDRLFAESMKKAGNVVGVSLFDTSGKGNFVVETEHHTIEMLEKSMLAFGFTGFDRDVDGFVRYARLKKEIIESRYTFGLVLLAKYLGKSEEDILKYAPVFKYRSAEGVRINYCGKPFSFKSISFYRVLRGEFEQDFFKDKIVLVGATAPILHDEFPTPFFENEIPMPGVEIHANLIDNLLAKKFLYKLSAAGNVLIIFLFGMLTTFFAMRFGASRSLLLTVFEIIVYFFINLFLFNAKDLWIEMVYPLWAMLLVYMGIILFRFVTEGRERRKLKETFQRYVSRDVVEEILSHPDQVALKGRRMKITIFFSDIRNFTTLSEKLTPEQIVEMLNEYFTAMTEVALKYKGTIDKFIGDALMCIFGAPIPHADDAERAVRASVEMLERLDQLCKKWCAEGRDTFRIGIGLNTGEAVVGNIGSAHKMEYTVIGDSVNVASRIESLNKQYNATLLISGSVYQETSRIIEAKYLGSTQVKGKKEPVEIYQVFGLKKAEQTAPDAAN